MVHALVRLLLRSSRSCSFTALLHPSYFPLTVASSSRDFCLRSFYFFGIRGISYLAQIQSYEYNFPREQSFIVIVNPSVNCPALSITAVRRYNFVLSPSLLSFQPLPSYRRHHSQTSISRRNTPRCSGRDEDEDGDRRVKGLYELIRTESDDWRCRWEGVAISEMTSSRGNETPVQRVVIRSYEVIERGRSIDPIHSASLLLVCLPMHYFLNINAFYPRPINLMCFLWVCQNSWWSMIISQFNKLFSQLSDLNDNIVIWFVWFYSYNYYLMEYNCP